MKIPKQRRKVSAPPDPAIVAFQKEIDTVVASATYQPPAPAPSSSPPKDSFNFMRYKVGREVRYAVHSVKEGMHQHDIVRTKRDVQRLRKEFDAPVIVKEYQEEERITLPEKPYAEVFDIPRDTSGDAFVIEGTQVHHFDITGEDIEEAKECVGFFLTVHEPDVEMMKKHGAVSDVQVKECVKWHTVENTALKVRSVEQLWYWMVCILPRIRFQSDGAFFEIPSFGMKKIGEAEFRAQWKNPKGFPYTFISVAELPKTNHGRTLEEIRADAIQQAKKQKTNHREYPVAILHMRGLKEERQPITARKGALKVGAMQQRQDAIQRRTATHIDKNLRPKKELTIAERGVRVRLLKK